MFRVPHPAPCHESSFLKQRCWEVQEPAFAAQTAGPLVASFVFLPRKTVGRVGCFCSRRNSEFKVHVWPVLV